MKHASKIVSTALLAAWLSTSAPSALAQDNSASAPVEPDTSRLLFAAGEFGYVVGENGRDIQAQAIKMADNNLARMVDYCNAPRPADMHGLEDLQIFCEGGLEGARDNLEKAKAMSRQDHIDAVSAGIYKEINMETNIGEYTQDGFLANEEIIAFLVEVANAREGMLPVEPTQRHIDNVQAFLSQVGVSDADANAVRTLARMDAFMEQRELERLPADHPDRIARPLPEMN